MFKGAFTAIVTPFKNNAFDEDGFRELIEFQISNKISGLVPCGTTGESATLTHEEHKKVIEVAIDAAANRVLVIAGAGSNSTEETIELTKHAKEAGADGALLITPYYNKPTQEGLYLHYKKIAESVNIPLVLYNVPSRTSVHMLPETIARLSVIDNIVGIKEATANMEHASWIRSLCREPFSLLSGDDATTLPFLAIGGDGVISVVSNVVPREMSELCNSYFAGDSDIARSLHYKLLSLNKVLFLETNPIPVKEALHIMGKISEEIRLPLTRFSEKNSTQLRTALKELKIIS